jgi:heme-degrading monooxygenase HmoA
MVSPRQLWFNETPARSPAAPDHRRRPSRHSIAGWPQGADLNSADPKRLLTGDPMILEVADIRIQPGQNAAFEEAIQRALATVASQAAGMQGFSVTRGIESPERYILQIVWATLEDHTVGFREGPLFAQWRAIIGPFFAGPPSVEHFSLVTKSA